MRNVLSEDLLSQAAAIACEEDYRSEVIENPMKHHRFSEEFERQMEELLRPQKRRRSYQKVKMRYLLVAVLAALMLGSTVLAVDSVREQIFEYFEKLFSDHTDIYYRQEKGEAKESIPEEEIMRPEYVPEGFVLEEEVYHEENGYYMRTYADDDGHTLTYTQAALQYWNGASITSGGKQAEEIPMDIGSAYLVTDDKGVKSVFYEMNGYILEVGGLLSEEELIKILKNVKFPEKN